MLPCPPVYWLEPYNQANEHLKSLKTGVQGCCSLALQGGTMPVSKFFVLAVLAVSLAVCSAAGRELLQVSGVVDVS